MPADPCLPAAEPYWAWIPACLRTNAHFVISPVMCSARSRLVPPVGVAPISANCLWISGMVRTALSSRLRRSRMTDETPLGASSANQVDDSNWGYLRFAESGFLHVETSWGWILYFCVAQVFKATPHLLKPFFAAPCATARPKLHCGLTPASWRCLRPSATERWSPGAQLHGPLAGSVRRRHRGGHTQPSRHAAGQRALLQGRGGRLTKPAPAHISTPARGTAHVILTTAGRALPCIGDRAARMRHLIAGTGGRRAWLLGPKRVQPGVSPLD